MTNVAIVYYSGYGHTAKQAEAVRAGAAGVSGATAELFAIDKEGNLPDAAYEKLKAADAIVYGSPTYMGGPAWQFKKFADASSKYWVGREFADKIAGGFTTSASSNGDKAVTISYFWTLSQQHGQFWVGTGLLPSSQKANTPDDVNFLGGFAGALARAPADASPEEGPGKGDLETAKLLGKRIAEVAAKWRSK